MDRLILLIPCWEGQRADPEEKQDPRKTSSAGRSESWKALDLNTPNREESRNTKSASRTGGQGHPTRDAQAVESLFYNWSKEFLEAGKKRLAGDTARAATTGEVKQLRRETRDLKEVVAEQALELRLLKKSMIADGSDDE